MQEILLFKCVCSTEKQEDQQTQRVRGLKLGGLLFNFCISLQGQNIGYCHADGKEENNLKYPAKGLKIRKQYLYVAKLYLDFFLFCPFQCYCVSLILTPH